MQAFSADSVASYISNMKMADQLRAADRVLIQDDANGVPPLTQQEAEENGVEVNVNFGMMTRNLQKARRQWENAFLKPSIFFTVELDDAPPENSMKWARIITKNINRVMKRSLSYVETLRSTFAGVCLHGIGPTMWDNKDSWEPFFVPIEDVLIPTNTELTMRKLCYFATRQRYTYLELADILMAKERRKGWNLDALKRLLDDVKLPEGLNRERFSWADAPEKIAELIKQNRTSWDQDSVPAIWVWNFYYKTKDKDGWFHCIVEDVPGTAAATTAVTRDPDDPKNGFLFKLDKPMADDWKNIICFQFGDGNNKPPFMYHSVRSMGYLLFSVCELLNRMQSQFFQHVFEQMTMLFRVNDPTDRGRQNKIMLFNRGVVPDGVNFVKSDERYQVDANLINSALAQFRQFISEISASYTQDVNDGTSRELTATEVMARVNDVNATITSMLITGYTYAKFQYMEIARRFCRKESEDKDVRKFRKKCIDEGVPEEWLDSEKWDIIPEQVLGGGHKMLEMTVSRELMALAPQLGPEAQEEVKRMHVSVLTDNPKLAERLVPTQHAVSTTATHDAELAFGALMVGSPVQPMPGLNRVEQIRTFLGLMDLKVKSIEMGDGMGTRQDVVGLSLCIQYVEQLIQPMLNDKNSKDLVKAVQQSLAQVENMVKAFAERQVEAQQKAQVTPDPAEMMKLELEKAKAAFQQQVDMQRLQMDNMRMQQQLQIQEMQSQATISRADTQAAADIARKDAVAQADIERKQRETQAAIRTDGASTAASISMDGAKTRATIQQGSAKTKAAIKQSEEKTKASIETQKKTAAAQAKLTAKKKDAKKPSP
jgi:hypothetical protein